MENRLEQTHVVIVLLQESGGHIHNVFFLKCAKKIGILLAKRFFAFNFQTMLSSLYFST